MKRKDLVLLLPVSLFALLATNSAGAVREMAPPDPDFVPGEIIVKFRDSAFSQPLAGGITVTGLPSVDVILGSLGTRGIFPLFPAASDSTESGLARTYILRLPQGADVLAAVQALQSNPNIEYAEPNYLAHISYLPNDTYFNLPTDYQWNLNNTGQTGGTSDADIDAPAAWDSTMGDASVIIAFLDTGVDLDHPDLSGKIWVNTNEFADGVDNDGNGYVDDLVGWDFVNGDNNPDDDHGHGSHVSGIAAADTDNAEGIAGVCPNCTIMPLKVCNSAGSCPYSAISSALHYAADNGAQIVSMSFGGGCSPTQAAAINYAWGNRVLMIAAAGNGGLLNGIDYPAAFRRVMAVGATDHYDLRAYFSDYGKKLDLVAPGVDILSSVPPGFFIPNFINPYYEFIDGTSMSTPHVSGVAGLVWSMNPALTFRQVWRILIKTADDLGAGGKDKYYGYGRVNADRAVDRALNPPRAIRQGSAGC